MQAKQLEYYLDRYATGDISQEEWTALQEILRQPENETVVDTFLDGELAALFAQGTYDDAVVQRVRLALNARINAEVASGTPAAPVHRIHLLKTTWFKYAAAIIILFGIGAYLWNTLNTHEDKLVQHTEPVPSKNDVQPGSNRAVLTLSDGRQVELTPSTGSIAETGTTIRNEDGRLKYSEGEKVVMNTMTTPRGGQYQLTLPDGTNVWLNAASSITYPTAFVNNIREVTITGEAYFEVTKNPSKPFVVKTPKEQITVLGTSFNVNAYPDETAIKTSLLEGAVRVGEKVLKPGEAFVNGKVFQTNVEQDVAWMRGAFDFNGMDLATVFRQLARWYDVDIEYAGKIPSKRIGGRMGRDLNLSQVLSALKKVGINAEIKGSTLLVLPE